MENSPKQPRDETAERATLGSILIEPSALHEATRIFGKHRPFSCGKYQTVWDAMLATDRQGIPVDLVTLTAELQRREELNRVGGVGALWELQEEVPNAANLPYYARCVLNTALAREITERANRVAQLAQQDNFDPLKVQEAIRALSDTFPENGTPTSSANLYDIREYFGHVSWTWQPWIPDGHLTLIVGITGIGKSYLTSRLIAGFTGAQPFPDNSRPQRTGRVLLIETEEFRGAFAQRLAAMSVPDDSVRLPSPKGDLTYLPNLLTDAPLFTSIAQTEECVAIVVDSLSGGHSIDENSAEMRAVLQTLTQIASKLNLPIIIVHHLRKRSTFEPMNATLDRVRGSSVITQFVRSVLGLWKPLDDDETVRVESLKCSFDTPPAPFGFLITQNGLDFCEAPETPRSETAIDRAIEFLRVELRREPQRFCELLAKAETCGISQRSLYRAREALKVVVLKGKWGLPPQYHDPR